MTFPFFLSPHNYNSSKDWRYSSTQGEYTIESLILSVVETNYVGMIFSTKIKSYNELIQVRYCVTSKWLLNNGSLCI